MSIDHVSASSISTFRDCPRKWAFRAIDGIEAPPNAGALLGSRVHTAIEEFLQTGKSPPEDLLRIITPGLNDLARLRDADCRIEQPIKFDCDGVPFAGRIDVWVPNETLVIDHKTTSSMHWALTPEDLRSNLQACIYAYWAAETGRAWINLEWHYYVTRGAPRHTVVSSRIGSDDYTPVVQAAAIDGQEMIRLADTGIVAVDVECNTSACDKYGGCPYRDRCDTARKTTFSRVFEALESEGRKAEPVLSPPEQKNPPPTVESKFKLYIDCRPLRTDERVVELASVLRPLLDKVAADFGVPDYRLVEYGKGPAALASLLRQSLTAVPLVGVSIVAMTRTQECQHTLFVLTELASEIVQGF